MSYPNFVYFPLLMRVLTSKCPILCPKLLKYIMHIQDSFKKKPEFKDFPLLINASDNRYCLSGFVLPSGRAFVKSLPQAEEICFVRFLKLLSTAMIQHVFGRSDYTFLTVLLTFQSLTVFLNLLYYRLIRVYYGKFISQIILILYTLKPVIYF